MPDEPDETEDQDVPEDFAGQEFLNAALAANEDLQDGSTTRHCLRCGSRFVITWENDRVYNVVCSTNHCFEEHFISFGSGFGPPPK